MTSLNYNPDVLDALANLSNDEVFTPPKLANQILDLLPLELWSNPTTTILDPATKSGVFLREAAKRFITGLELKIPDLQTRLDHIYSKQLFGIGITELTGLLTRRSLYCSKHANWKYSICTSFDTSQGNIISDKIQHTWANGNCIHCGASELEYSRDPLLENYAYQFIHTDSIQIPSLFHLPTDMKFDVIIGNPPYQLSDGGGRDSGAKPLYHLFIEQAKKLNPRYLTMIIPARWYAGGKGLDDFRKEMLNDERVAEIHDFPETSDCFPGINIRGGVCYFLWAKDHKWKCRVTNYQKWKKSITIERPLLEKDCEVFVRQNEAISILHKVKSFEEKTFDTVVSSRKPFGLESNFSNFKKEKNKEDDILLYRFGDNGYINLNQVEKNKDRINKIKVLVSKASPGGDQYPHSIISKPILALKNTCSTETYLIVGCYEEVETAENVIKYMHTRFFRFMMSLIKNTQNISKGVFAFVPLQDFTQAWTDEMLYKKYNLTPAEIEFIGSMIRPMI